MSKKNKNSDKGRRARTQQKMSKQKQMQQLMFYTAIVVIVVGAGFWLLWIQSNPSEAVVAESGFKLEQQPSRGSADAPVKVVEFGDFKCPACAGFHENVYTPLVQEFVWSNQVEFYFINFQFIGPDSTTSGIAGECIYDQDESAFWEYYDYIYQNQGVEARVWATEEWIMNAVRENIPGLNESELQQCIANETFKDRVEEDRRLGTAAGVTGTPSVFVNGQKISNWSYGPLKQAILQALEEAES
jgi:protein-disulfide isomerase